MQILLLHYVRTGGNAAALRHLGLVHRPEGRPDEGEIVRPGLRGAAASAFRPRSPSRRGALERLGATRQPGTPAPVAWRIAALPRVPVLLLYWPHDEEFPSKLKILFDATADRFLDVESLTFLIEGLVKNIEYGPDRAPHD